MNIWRGHILLVIALVSGLFGAAAVIGYFYLLRALPGNDAVFLVFMIGCVLVILSLTSGALAYGNWVPKWERDEKRTGHIPGDERKN